MSADSSPAAADSKWSDDVFLDRLRSSTDDDANQTVAHLKIHGGDLPAANRMLMQLRSINQELPAQAPQHFRDFRARQIELAKGCDIDHEIVVKGGEVFNRWAYPAAIVMLASSLPSGYSAPALSRVLTISDALAVHPYRRLLAVIQLLINISCQTHEDHPDAETSALQLRLLHGGVRLLVPENRPDYIEKFGLPVNHEDMLATIMGFSLLVIDGVKTLGFTMRDDEADAFWALWRHFSRLMAIAPSENLASAEFIPKTLADARAFYLSYQRRFFAQTPEENQDGVRLTERNRQMMIDLIPRPLRLIGLGRAPDILMTELLGTKGLEPLGMQAMVGHGFDKSLLHFFLKLGKNLGEIGEDFTSLFAATILKGMVKRGLGTVTFSVPDSVQALRRLAEPQRMKGNTK